MNNFLLNNTSIYLGGQCAWDIVLDKNKDEFEISGFQLAPISDNVPYNKRGSIKTLNDNHSETLKKYCSNLKETFWSTTFYSTDYTIDQYNNIEYEIDSSLISGFKRSTDYSVYKKQFCFFQPVWLESIPENSYLRFKFTVHPFDKPNNILGSRSVNFKPIDNTSEETFHDKFVSYLNDWLSYLHIIKTEENEGNDRSMYINLKEETAAISGVSTKTGQLNNRCGCDYVISNLLIYERPNVESDYILTSLFKNHNMVTSQLFNFKFYFNIEDILDKFIFNQLIGQKIYIKCECFIIDDNSVTSLEPVELFTNYNDIKKTTYNPFYFLDDMEFDSMGRWDIKYDCNPSVDYNHNVLQYLKDYEVASVKDINKLNQNICHWNSKAGGKNFNLYNGYQYVYYEFGDGSGINSINNIERNVISDTPTYTFYPKEIPYSNGISIMTLQKEYTQRDDFSWFHPGRVLYINSSLESIASDEDILTNIKTSISDKLFNKGVIGLPYNNRLSIDISNKTWGTNISPKDIANELYGGSWEYDDTENMNIKIDSIVCVYIKPVGQNWNGIWSNIKSFASGLYKIYDIYNGVGDNHHLMMGIDFGMAVFFTDDPKYLILDNIILSCKTFEEQQTADPSFLDEDKNRFKYILTTLNGIKSSIVEGNDGEFYQFNNELCVGYNKLGDKSYYKSDIKNTHVFRIGGSLTPLFIKQSESESFGNHNIFYGLNIKNNSIDSKEHILESGVFEISYFGGGWRILLASEIKFILKKDTLNDSTSLNDLIINHLMEIYGYDERDRDTVNRIFRLYFVSFDYEYEYNIIEGQTVVQTIYNVKLILK